MNRRHEHLSSQANKKNVKNVKNGVANKEKPPKENRWADLLQKQTEENNRRLESYKEKEK